MLPCVRLSLLLARLLLQAFRLFLRASDDSVCHQRVVENGRAREQLDLCLVLAVFQAPLVLIFLSRDIRRRRCCCSAIEVQLGFIVNPSGTSEMLGWVSSKPSKQVHYDAMDRKFHHEVTNLNRAQSWKTLSQLSGQTDCVETSAISCSCDAMSALGASAQDDDESE